MKKIPEHIIIEKFSEKSDPIEDMGIVLKAEYNSLEEGDTMYLIKPLDMKGGSFTVYPKDTYFAINRIQMFGERKSFNGLIYKNKKDFLEKKSTQNYEAWSMSFDWWKEYFRKVYPEDLKESVNEKFSEKSDPIEDMGIGLVGKIFQYSKNYQAFSRGFYTEQTWKEIIRWMLDEGYEPWQILLILDEKIMAWAYDASEKDLPVTLDDFQSYNVKYKSGRNQSEIDRILNNYAVMHPKWQNAYKQIAKQAGLYSGTIQEAFSEKGDPIRDMGIGVFSKHKFEDYEEAVDWVIYALPTILGTEEIPEDIIYGTGVFLNPKYFSTIQNYIQKYLSFPSKDLWNIFDTMKRSLLKMGFDVSDILDEKFSENSDPIHDMGIGGRAIRVFDTLEETANFFIDNIEKVSNFKSIEDLHTYIKVNYIEGAPIRTKQLSYNISLLSEVKSFLEGWNGEYPAIYIKEYPFPYDHEKTYKIQIIRDLYFVLKNKLFAMNEKSVNEKFTEKGDPLDDMGIGIYGEFQKELDEITNPHMSLYNVAEYLFNNRSYVGASMAVKKILKKIIEDKILKEENKDTLISFLRLLRKSNGLSDTGVDIIIKYFRNKFNIELPDFRKQAYEAFSEKGDPIEDMNIGIYSQIQKELDKINNIDSQTASEYLFNNDRYQTSTTFVREILEEIIKHKLFREENQDKLLNTLRKIRKSCGLSNFGVNLVTEYFRDKMNIELPDFRKQVYEKFSETGDPIEDMGIGIKREIERWIKQNDTQEEVGYYYSPATFIAENQNDKETAKLWIEYLLRQGKEPITAWEEESVQNMIDAGVQFIPNSKKLPIEDFSYKVKDGQYYLYAKSWDLFTECIDPGNDVDERFISDVLMGQDYNYFDYNNDIEKLNDIADSIYPKEQKKLFEYLKSVCLEYSESVKDAKDLNSLLTIIDKDSDFEKINNALRLAYLNNIAEAELVAAHEDIVQTIKLGFKIIEEKHNKNQIVLQIKEEGLNTLFKAYYSKDYRPQYNPPRYGWHGKFNLEYFIDDFEGQI